MAQNIIYILIALLFSAFFSGVEIAFVSSNKVVFELDKKKKGLTTRILNVFYRNYEVFISTMLVGNNIALVIYGILMAQLLEAPIARLWNNEIFIVITQTLGSTLLILVTAEFLPKTIFKLNPNLIMRMVAMPLAVIYVVLWPVAQLSTLISRIILKLFGLNMSKSGYHGLLTKVDLDFFIQQRLEDSTEASPTDPEVILFQNALDFSSIKVRECMIPRNELVGVNVGDSLDHLMQTFINSGFSKILVYGGSKDKVEGYIHSAEMFKRPEDWTTMIKEVPFVPESMAVNKLMAQLLEQKKSIAVVLDEFGGTSGIITMEDMFEEIFGDFEDEYDIKRYVIRQLNEETFVLSGRLEISKINDELGLDIPESDEYITLAGYILHYHTTLPQVHDEIRIHNYLFKILKISTAKIELVRVQRIKK